MQTAVADTSLAVAVPRQRRLALRLPAAALASRVIVLAAAIAGATLTSRVADWRHGDPHGLTLSLGWLGNALASAGVRWDSIHYQLIADHGYTNGPNTPFFPLYPMLIRAGSWLTGSDIVAGLLVSAAAFAGALWLLQRIARDELGADVGGAAVLLLAFSPLSLFLTAVYTESLFLVFSLGAFALARRERFGWASVAAAAATLTHVEGVLLIVPLAMLYWHSSGEVARTLSGSGAAARSAVERSVVAATQLSLPLLALCTFLAFLHSRGFGWLAPFTGEHYYGHHFVGPIAGVAEGVGAGIAGLAQMAGAVIGIAHGAPSSHQQAFLNVLDLGALVICLAALAATWKRLPSAYGVYSGLCLLTCVSSPVSGAPLTSVDRYTLVIFPLWIGAAAWLQERRLLRPVLAGSAALMLVFSAEFGRWVFIG